MFSERYRKLPTQSVEGDSHFSSFQDYQIDVYKLINLAESVEIETVPVEALHDNIYGNYWKDAEDNWISPHQILAELSLGNPNWDEVKKNHPAWKDEIEKIRNADYHTYPLLVIDTTIVDGMHRFTRALAEGAVDVNIKKFPNLPEESIATL